MNLRLEIDNFLDWVELLKVYQIIIYGALLGLHKQNCVNVDFGWGVWEIVSRARMC